MNNLDNIRSNTLKQIEQNENRYKMAFILAALIEVAFLVVYLYLADLSNRTHVLLLISIVALYTIIGAGLVALGLHVTRTSLRVIKAIETTNKT